MSTINVDRLSDEELVNYFEGAFEQQVALHNDITSFEVTCDRESGKPVMAVEIIGMAGSPTCEAFKGDDITHRDEVVVDEGDLGKINFEFNGTCYVLNSTDYVAEYKVVE